MSGDLSALRRDYASRALTEEDAFADAIAQFSAWWTEAVDSQLLEKVRRLRHEPSFSCMHPLASGRIDDAFSER